MGVQDRDYMKERHGHNTSPKGGRSSQKMLTSMPIKISARWMASLVIALTVLLLAISSNAPTLSSSCRVEKIAFDSNSDGTITYREFGGGILRIVPQPIRVASQFDTLAPALGFFELNKNNCNSRGSIFASGFLLSACLLGAIYILSLAFFLFSKVAKYIVVDLIGVSPYGQYKLLASGLICPRFFWVIHPVIIVIFAAALTVIFTLKMPSANVKQKSDNNISVIQTDIA